MRNILTAIVLIFLFLMLLVPKASPGVRVDIVKVVDGDTVVASIDDNQFKIRLKDIDCYEGTINERAQWQAKKFHLNIEDITAGGELAKQAIETELKDKQITFEFKGIDKYNRALGYIYANNKNVNKRMLTTSYCHPYEKMTKD
ncbi:MAG: thermonuclease family protein [Candidatus Gastranaerophilales bacterium]|nr:thermonuclease family protein [Candidatus Gastranaerophilales bacterium]